ncbi:MAG TPA: polysaccharide deacetylase family protein [Candidatus Methylomirabilis sp.]|nr:polysaccharide deacetylase family protein [Candidatus Methylomirabilis sp.]
MQRQACPYSRGRRCRRCGEPIRWTAVRLVGWRAYCSETCAIISLADEASRTAWRLTALKLGQGPRDLRGRLHLLLARRHTWLVQRRLDRRLDAGPRTQSLPWVWLPPRRTIAGLALTLAVWGATGGPAPESRAVVPLPSPVPPSLAHLPPPRAHPAPPSDITPSVLAPGRATAPALDSPRQVAPWAPPHPARPRPISLVRGDDLTRGSTAIREVAFTFDGGDEANVADEILTTLRTLGVRATMFLTGQFIRLFPDVVRRMAADGHEIANHLDTHPHLTTYAQNHRQQTLPGATREFLLGELRRAEVSFRDVTGLPLAPFWRAPYGEHNAEIRAWAAEAGYRHISWTRGAGTAEDLDTRDWVADRSSRIYRSRQEIATRILEFGRGHPEGLNGGVILLHLATHRRTDRPHESLPEILQTLQRDGYRVVTVSELIGHLQPVRAEVGPATPPPVPAPAVVP